jgi:hypothetical protein
VDGAEWILGLDAFHVELAAVVQRAAAAAKDSLRAYFDGGSDGGLSKVSPQYSKGIKDALASPNVTPLEFRLVLVYLYQYLELYYMFDMMMGISAGMDGLVQTSHVMPSVSDAAVVPPTEMKAYTVSSSTNATINGGMHIPSSDLSVDEKRRLPKHIAYPAFVAGGGLLIQWGLDADEFSEPDILFRRINGGRDGVILFTDFAIWASREQLHVEDPTFAS